MPYSNVILEKKGQIWVATVNRPGDMNALNLDTLKDLRSAIDEVAKDREARVLIVTGAADTPPEGKKPKPRAFVAGADIKLMATIKPGDRSLPGEFVDLGQEVMQKLERLPIPVIAAVDGYALGGGTELAISCDIIYASTRAAFGQPEVKLGLIPGFGGTQRLPRLIGRNLAKELIYTGDIINAERAHQIGLVNAVYPPEDLMSKVFELAERIIAAAPLAVTCCKRSINEGYHHDLDTGNRIEVDYFMSSFISEDRLEGTGAFVEKRAPKFTGK